MLLLQWLWFHVTGIINHLPRNLNLIKFIVSKHKYCIKSVLVPIHLKTTYQPIFITAVAQQRLTFNCPVQHIVYF